MSRIYKIEVCFQEKPGEHWTGGASSCFTEDQWKAMMRAGGPAHLLFSQLDDLLNRPPAKSVPINRAHVTDSDETHTQMD